MISAAIVLLIVGAFLWSMRTSGLTSFLTMGVIGSAVYSIPAIVGLVYPFQMQLGSVDTSLVPMATMAQYVVAFAWLIFLLTLILLCALRRPRIVNWSASKGVDYALVNAFIAVSVFGFILIAAEEGPLFFLEARSEQGASTVKLLWRWANAFGFLAAVIVGARMHAAIFLLFLILYFLAGDRTVITITAICYFVVARPWGGGIDKLRPFYLVASFALLAAFIVLGKPIYTAVRIQSLEPVLSSFSAESVEVHIKAFEPFITANLLDLTVTADLKIAVGDWLSGLVGQLLIVPSFFGIDSNAFNTQFTDSLSLHLSWGVAGNYWAQAYAVAGFLGVAAYAVLLCSILVWCDANSGRRGAVKILIAFIGATFAVYAYRNSLDNMLSFVRQFLVVAVMGTMLSAFIRGWSRRRRRRKPDLRGVRSTISP